MYVGPFFSFLNLYIVRRTPVFERVKRVYALDHVPTVIAYY
jgi:hypothetical protein